MKRQMKSSAFFCAKHFLPEKTADLQYFRVFFIKIKFGFTAATF